MVAAVTPLTLATVKSPSATRTPAGVVRVRRRGRRWDRSDPHRSDTRQRCSAPRYSRTPSALGEKPAVSVGSPPIARPRFSRPAGFSGLLKSNRRDKHRSLGTKREMLRSLLLGLMRGFVHTRRRPKSRYGLAERAPIKGRRRIGRYAQQKRRCPPSFGAAAVTHEDARSVLHKSRVPSF
jgi:hypothetical protein